MVNNAFSILGLATTNFEELTNKDEKYKSYIVIIELEMIGSKLGNHFEIPVTFYQTNKVIDVKQSIKGKTVVVNGYCTGYRANSNYLMTKLVGQNLYVVDNARLVDILDYNDKNCFSSLEL